MSDFDTDEVEVTQDELTSLKAKADLLGLSYHPSIGLKSLREKVAAALTDKSAVPQETESLALPVVEPEAAKRSRNRKEASELVRVRITCMNPNKKEWEGEIFTAGNAMVGTFKKFVPFNNEEGWHIPRIIYKQLIQRQCQIFVTSKDGRGNKSRKGKLIKEFAIEVLPALTAEELAELAQRQAMAKSID